MVIHGHKKLSQNPLMGIGLGLIYLQMVKYKLQQIMEVFLLDNPVSQVEYGYTIILKHPIINNWIFRKDFISFV
jgi:hypothetical protein